ncbi:MAG: hypothetical protein HYR85_10540 [Planctomycetes bacterium]|nr:hypothetical protein [Planctomycetota bacterium]MBI3845093.1 hypothetical protein [Planctomycetota bacterium]
MTDDSSPGPAASSQPPPSKKRRPFIEPPPSVPLHKTSEFQRISGLFLLLMVLVVFALMFWESTPKALERVFRTPAQQPTTAGSDDKGAPVDPNAEAEARRLAQEERRRRILTLFQGSLADAVDGADFNESEGYRLMIRQMSQYSPEDVKRRVTGPLDYDRALHDPDSLRGQFVRTRGICFQLSAIKLDAPIGGLNDVYRGYLFQPDGTEPLAFDLPYRPDDFKTGWQSDPVDVEGIFYRTVGYEAKGGTPTRGKHVEIPYLLARNIVAVQTVASGPSNILAGRAVPVVVGLLLVTIVASLVIYRLSRVRRRSGQPPPPVGFRQMFEKKLREERRNARSEPPA